MPIQPAYLVYGIVEDEDRVSMIEGRAVEEIRYKDIAAIVRRVEIDDGGKPSKEQLQNWLIDHQQTNSALFRNHTLLPLRFGTIVSRKEEMQDSMATYYLRIKMVLAMVRGNAEFVVQLFWDLKAVLNEIYQDRQELQEDRNLVESGRLLFEAAEKRRGEIVESAHYKLSAVSLSSSEAKRADESMIMNRSYLIERTSEGVFDEVMAGLGRESPSYLHFKYVGPLPPYSFVPLEFRKGNFALLDQARKTLSLPERVRLGEIKTAYRTLSLRYHPDRNPGDKSAENRFREIAEAYELLETYCLRCGMILSQEEDPEYFFTSDATDKVFVVV